MSISPKQQKQRVLRKQYKDSMAQPRWITFDSEAQQQLSEWLSAEQLADLQQALKFVAIKQHESEITLPPSELKKRLQEIADKAQGLNELVKAHQRDLYSVTHRECYPEWALSLPEDSQTVLVRLQALAKNLEAQIETKAGSRGEATLRLLADIGLRRLEQSGTPVTTSTTGKASQFLQALFIAAGFETTDVRRHLRRYKEQET